MHKYTKEQIDNVIEDYKNGKLMRELRDKYNMSESVISYHIGKAGFRRTRSQIKTKYTVNHNYFENIDTKEKAYILGFLYADGCNNENIGRFDIGLSTCDIEILNLMKKEYEYSGPITSRDYTTIKGKITNQSILCISSKKMSKDLSINGCVSRKSLILNFPDNKIVPNNLIWHFIRGYFDGDGNLIRKYAQARLCVSFEFAKKMKSFLDINNIFSYFYQDKGTKIYRLQIGKVKDCMRFLYFMYKDSNGLRLERKYEIYKNHLTKYKNKYIIVEDKIKTINN